MRALVFHRPKHVSVDRVDDPTIEAPSDAIVRVTSTAICGSDLHMFNGFFPQIRHFVLGHEFMGIVEEVGPNVHRLTKGDRVVVPFPIACGSCFFCERSLPVHCERSNPKHYGPEGGLLSQKGGGLFGYTDLYGGYAGGQAEYVRVPYADYGPRRVPDTLSDEQALFLTDIFPTGWAAVDWAEVHGGETVAVFGCGPVGLMAQKSAWLRGARRVIAVDRLPYRLELAKKVASAETIDSTRANAALAIRDLTDGRGADVCIDAVGMEAHRGLGRKLANVLHLEVGTISVLKDCCSAVRRGGVVSVVGVYGIDYDGVPLGQIFDKGIRLRFGQAPVHRYIDELIKRVSLGDAKLDDIITHRIPLAEAAHGYAIFNAKEDGCVKVVLKP